MSPGRRLLNGLAGTEVSQLGLGAWALGGRGYGPVAEEDAIAAIDAYLETGGNLIDTARMYGRSEELIGRVLRSRRTRTIIVSKTASGARMDTVPDIRTDIEATLRALQTDYVDIFMLHVPPEDCPVREAALDALEELRTAGLVRLIGASIKGPAVDATTIRLCRDYVDGGRIDVVEVVFSVLRQKIGSSDTLAMCERTGVGVISRTALESGFLSGRYSQDHRFDPGDHRSRWSQRSRAAIAEALEELRTIAAEAGTSLSELAIRFALTQPHIGTVLLGARSATQVHRNLELAAEGPLPEETYRRLIGWGEGRTESFNP